MPERVGLDAKLPRRSHLVQDGDCIEKPDLVADVAVDVVVGEVCVQGSRDQECYGALRNRTPPATHFWGGNASGRSAPLGSGAGADRVGG